MPKQDVKPTKLDRPSGLSGVAGRSLLLLLFAGSGCSALIYEIVWYQLLQLVIGSTAISLGVLLATFMGGLCLGSLALPRILSARKEHPLRVYAKVEVGIAICGVLVLLAMPLLDGVYTAAVGHGLPAILLRALVCGAVPAAAHVPDGRIAAGRGALARDQSGRRFVDGAALRRATPAARSWAACWRASTCCANSIWGPRPSRPRPSMWRSRWRAFRWPAARPQRAVGGEPVADRATGGARLLAGVRDHRALGRHGAGRGSDLDAPAGPDAGRHGLHLLHHSGGVSGGAGAGQFQRVDALADGEAAAGARPEPTGAGRRHRVDRRDAEQVAALLAHQPAALHQLLVHLPGGPGAHHVGDSSGDAPVGRQLSAGAGVRGIARGGFGASLVGGIYAANTAGAIAGRAVLQPGAGAVDRHAGLRTRADRAGGGERDVHAGAARDAVEDRARLAVPGGGAGRWPGCSRPTFPARPPC